MGGRFGPLWRIQQAPEEIQGGNTQCEHPERKSLRGSGNTIPQESGCLLHSGDQIPRWQLPHNQGQGHHLQALLVRKRKGTADVGVFVAEEWIEKVFEVQRVSERIILVKLVVGQRVVTFLSVYAPQSGPSDEVKDLFFDQLRAVTARIPASEFLIPCGDWNGHVGHAGTGYREVHGGMGYGRPKPDVVGERILEYALAFDLLLGNTCFKKRDSHLITYKSGNIATQIDFILFHRTMRKLVTDVKVIPGKEVALQHQLLVCDMRIDVPPKSKRKFTPRLKVWKLKDPQTSNHFQEVFNLHVSTSAGVADGATEDIWNNIKTGLLKTTEEVCGTTQPHRWRRETWWWNEHVEKAIAAKRTAFKKPTRRSTRISTPSLQKSTALLTSLEERTLMLLVTNL